MAASLDVSIPAMGSLSIDDPSAKEDDNDRPVVDGETVGSWNPRQAYDYKSYTATRDPDAPRNEPYGEWAASGARYEWDNDYGDLAPRCEKLERMLFDLDDDEPCAGIDFRRLFTLKVQIEGITKPDPITNFDDAKLHCAMLDNIALSKYTKPTPIQRYCIPLILQGHDLLSCAQTGSGKTAAFLIPILSKLMGKAKKLAAPRPNRGDRGDRGIYTAEPLVLIIAPTRELATQIFDECRRFCYRSMLRPCVVYGGADITTQRLELGMGCDVLVGTPGRTLDFLERGRILSLKRVKYIVVDEADEMLDMGFEPQVRRILETSDCNQDDDKQVMMFSATFKKPIRKLAADFLSDDYVQIKVGRIGSTPENIVQNVIWVDETKKKQALYDLLCTSPPARTMIFVNRKLTADTLDDYLYNHKLPTTSIHGDRTQREREDALIAFRSGKCPILIATGIASRGLDIKNVLHIVNYDMVANIDEYIHRIGRTARIGNHGIATTFYNENNSGIAPDLVKILMENKQDIPPFLEEYKPEGELNFDEPESDDETPAMGGDDAGVGDWGNSGTAGNDDGW